MSAIATSTAWRATVTAAALAAGASLYPPMALAIDPLTGGPECSIFDMRPCKSQPDGPGERDMRLTIESRELAAGAAHVDKELDTMRLFFAALRACWQPPPLDKAKSRLEISVRLSFSKTGDIIGRPRVTYTSPNTTYETKQVYWNAIVAALDRCTPMPFTKDFGNAVAGRPIAIRFVDNRK